MRSAAFDPAMLSDSQMMDLFFTPCRPANARRELGGDPSDACSWSNVACNGEGDVVSISWCSFNIFLTGEIDLAKIPRKAAQVTLDDLSFDGEADVTALPHSLVSLSLRLCRFYGTLNLSRLPPRMTHFSVASNRISALEGVTNLPETLKSLTVNDQNLTHTSVCVDKLPPQLLEVDFTECGFTDVQCACPDDLRRVQLVEAKCIF